MSLALEWAMVTGDGPVFFAAKCLQHAEDCLPPCLPAFSDLSTLLSHPLAFRTHRWQQGQQCGDHLWTDSTLLPPIAVAVRSQPSRLLSV